jgi:MFS family permease
MGIALFGFGSISFLPLDLLIPVALALRAFQGLSSGLIQTTSYTIVAILYPDSQQKYLGILEASMGFGQVVGPVIGATLYTFIDFQGTFYLIGGIFLISVVILSWVIPETINKTDKREEGFSSDRLEEAPSKKDEDTTSQEEHAITYTEVLKQRIFVCSAIAAFFGYFDVSFMEPVLSLRLMEFDLSKFWIGVFFCLYALGYILGSLTVGVFSKRFENKILI